MCLVHVIKSFGMFKCVVESWQPAPPGEEPNSQAFLLDVHSPNGMAFLGVDRLSNGFVLGCNPSSQIHSFDVICVDQTSTPRVLREFSWGTGLKILPTTTQHIISQPSSSFQQRMVQKDPFVCLFGVVGYEFNLFVQIQATRFINHPTIL